MQLSPEVYREIMDHGSAIDERLSHDDAYAQCTSGLGRALVHWQRTMENLHQAETPGNVEAVQAAAYHVLYQQIQLYGEDSLIIDSLSDADARLLDDETWDGYFSYKTHQVLTEAPAPNENPDVAETEVARACLDVMNSMDEFKDTKLSNIMREAALEGTRRTISRTDSSLYNIPSLSFVKNMKEHFPEEITSMVGFHADYEDLSEYLDDWSWSRVEEMEAHHGMFLRGARTDLMVEIVDHIAHRNKVFANECLDAWHYDNLLASAKARNMDVNDYVATLDDADRYPALLGDLHNLDENQKVELSGRIGDIIHTAVGECSDYQQVAHCMAKFINIVEPSEFGRDFVDDAIVGSLSCEYAAYNEAHKDTQQELATLIAKEAPEVLLGKDEVPMTPEFGTLSDTVLKDMANAEIFMDYCHAAWEKRQNYASEALASQLIEGACTGDTEMANEALGAWCYQRAIDISGTVSKDNFVSFKLFDPMAETGLDKENKKLLTWAVTDMLGYNDTNDNPTQMMVAMSKAFVRYGKEPEMVEAVARSLRDGMDKADGWSHGEWVDVATKVLIENPEILLMDESALPITDALVRFHNMSYGQAELATDVALRGRELSSEVKDKFEINWAIDAISAMKKKADASPTSPEVKERICGPGKEAFQDVYDRLYDFEINSVEGGILRDAYDALVSKPAHSVSRDTTLADAMAYSNYDRLYTNWGKEVAHLYLDSLGDGFAHAEDGAFGYVKNLFEMSQTCATFEESVLDRSPYELNVLRDVTKGLSADNSDYINEVFAKNVANLIDTMYEQSESKFVIDTDCSNVAMLAPHLFEQPHESFMSIYEVMSSAFPMIEERRQLYPEDGYPSTAAVDAMLKHPLTVEVKAADASTPQASMDFER